MGAAWAAPGIARKPAAASSRASLRNVAPPCNCVVLARTTASSKRRQVPPADPAAPAWVRAGGAPRTAQRRRPSAFTDALWVGHRADHPLIRVQPLLGAPRWRPSGRMRGRPSTWGAAVPQPLAGARSAAAGFDLPERRRSSVARGGGGCRCPAEVDDDPRPREGGWRALWWGPFLTRRLGCSLREAPRRGQ